MFASTQSHLPSFVPPESPGSPQPSSPSIVPDPSSATPKKSTLAKPEASPIPKPMPAPEPTPLPTPEPTPSPTPESAAMDYASVVSEVQAMRNQILEYYEGDEAILDAIYDHNVPSEEILAARMALRILQVHRACRAISSPHAHIPRTAHIVRLLTPEGFALFLFCCCDKMLQHSLNVSFHVILSCTSHSSPQP